MTTRHSRPRRFSGVNSSGNQAPKLIPACARMTAWVVIFLACFSLAYSKSYAAPASPAPTAYDPNQSLAEKEAADKWLPGGTLKMSGRYRIAAGVNQDQDFVLNDADVNRNIYNLQGPNFEYLFGERLTNTFDPKLYSQQLINVDFSPADRFNFYTQIVNDPWSLVGTTGEQITRTDPGDATVNIRYNLKYFGNTNSTITEIYRANDADRYNFPKIKVHDGQLTGTRLEGLDQLLAPDRDHRGIPINIPQLQIDYEYRPIRKLWMDYNEDAWHARVFALADQEQALTSDDPLGLSNHKDYWQQSPWLYQYKAAQHFIDVSDIRSIKRGYYSDGLSFAARDSEGNRLVLLRGVSFEGNFDRFYLASTVAAPFTPWDKHFFDADNVPGAVRAKWNVTDKWMLGGLYTFRSGLIDDEIADFNTVTALDTEYKWNADIKLTGEVAYSRRDQDLKEADRFHTVFNGYAYQAAALYDKERGADGERHIRLSYAQMDQSFRPLLSRYMDTRDDAFWGNHISFDDRPDLEPFRLGDGLDVNRRVGRFEWKEKAFQKRFYNLFDVRNVHKTNNTAYVETVVREEAAYRFNSKLKGKFLFRWRGLPETTPNIEPALVDFFFPKDDLNLYDFTIRNDAVKADQDADQFTYSAGLQYQLNRQWTLEGIAERSNLIPDFPRGLLDDFFKDANERVDGILEDRITNFLYGQAALKAAPPYPYFNLFKERITYQPSEFLKLIFHAAQNSYKFAGGIDDNVTHVGLSADFKYSQKASFFGDYTLSRQVAIPHLIADDYRDFDNARHHNVYFSAEYRLNSKQLFRAEYGVFGIGSDTKQSNPYSTSRFNLPTMDTEHLLRLYLLGEF